MIVLDTDVLSMVASAKAQPDAALATWLHKHEPDLFVSEATLFEINSGIRKLQEKGASRRASAYQEWFDAIVMNFDRRWLPLRRNVLLRAGELKGQASARGLDINTMDCCIAATAETHGFRVATFNLKDFLPLGVSVIRPPSDSDAS